MAKLDLNYSAPSPPKKDFRIGVRAIFRMHEAANGEWTWLTYIQDQMILQSMRLRPIQAEGFSRLQRGARRS